MLIKVDYPDVVKDIRDVKASLDAGDKAGEKLEQNIDEIDSNLTIKTSAESGIARRENILGIQPLETSSLEDRRTEVLLRWWQSTLYTEVTLRQKLDAAFGQDGYILRVDLDNKVIDCQVDTTRRYMLASIEDLLEQMVPLDYGLAFSLRYNQYKKYKPYTNKQMKKATYYQLRNEEVKF